MRIVGICGTGTQSRTFESFPKIEGMVVYGPSPAKAADYPSNIKNFKNAFAPLPPKWPKVIAKQLNKSGPIDILITAFGGHIPKQINAKYRVILAHGEVGKNIVNISPKEQKNYDGVQKYWGGYDLICGGMTTIKKYIVDDMRVKDAKFLFNALPQYDLVYKYNNSKVYRKILFNRLGRKYKETIMFIGFCCRNAVHFVPNNEDYFRALKVLIDYAKANPDSLIVTKSRKSIEAMEEWLRRYKKAWGGWTKKYYGVLAEAQKQKNIHWMDGKIPLYPYFFCDKIVINASSTLETEGILAAKPVIVFKSKHCPLEDGFNAAKEGTVEFAKIEAELKYALYNYNKIDLNARGRWMKKAKLAYDGLHSQRIVDKMMKL